MSTDDAPPSFARTLAQALLLGVVYFGAVRIATAISVPNVSIAPVRLPNAFAITALLLTPPSTWWIYLLAIVPRNVFGFASWTVGIQYFVANSTEILIAAFAVRRMARGHPRLDNLRQSVAFVAVAVVLAPMVGGLIGASAVQRVYPNLPFLDNWRVWFLGDAVGNLAIVPALLALGGVHAMRAWRPLRAVEGAALAVGIVVGSLPTLGVLGAPGAFQATALSMLYVPFPLLIWAALRFGAGGAAGANVLLAAVSVFSALQGRGPFARLDNPTGVLILQQFLIVAGATAVILAAAAEERRRTLAALRASETKFARVFAASPDSITLSRIADGVLVDVNEGFTRLVNLSRANALGKSPADLDILDDPQQCELMRDAVLKGPIRNALLHVRPRGETTRVCLLSAVRVDMEGEPCVLCVVRDITEYRQIEEALQDAEQRYRSLLDTATDVILTINFAGQIETANQAFEALTGWTRGDWSGQAITSFLAPEDIPVARALIESLRRGETPPMREWRVRTHSGEWRVSEVKVSIFRRGGKPAGLLLIARDVTDRRRAEQEHTRLEEQMGQVRKLEAVGQLAGGIAHDFNNILQAILGFADLAREEAPPGTHVADHLNKVIESAERARTLTRQLLTFSRRETVTPKVLDVLTVIAEFNQILRRVLPANVTLSLVGSSGTPPVVADRGHVEQIVMNLCVNANDAMPDGGTIAVTVGRERLDAAFAAAHPWARAGDFVTITVSDTGSGIDPDALPRIFEPFFTTKDIGKGTGLGLATVYGIVQRYEGVIDVQSEPARGTTFRVYLPARLEPVAAGRTPAAEHPDVPGGTELILVAEDEPLVRSLAVSQLRRAGYRVLEASDGATAIELFRAHGPDIDLAFLDVMMPRGDGRSVRRAIRERRPALPVLFATGYADRERERPADAGDDIINKPYTTELLLTKVRALLDGAPR